VLAFDRVGAVSVVTRLPVGLRRRGGWGDTRLDLAGRWRDVLTDRVPGNLVGDVLRDLPVALLVRED
jgi:(1->4)-alpha-D-glucan 1-alpha-D-glucosylmutase